MKRTSLLARFSARQKGVLSQVGTSVVGSRNRRFVVPPTDLQSGTASYCIYENLV